ncbi:hypothetical protein TNCV_2471391 [Trichonephila clavipes]|nr:hypothetical protein TNCV_2471391 [Trichonephila clavipes]
MGGERSSGEGSSDGLDAYVHLYAGAVGDTFVLEEDNARPHRARIGDAYIEQKTIQRMQWSAESPYHYLACLRGLLSILFQGPCFQLPWNINGLRFV